MTSSPKRATPAVPTKPAPPRKKLSAPVSKPFLRFYQTPKLREKTLKVLDTIESAEDAAAHAGQLADLVLELVESGMNQYFLQSLKAAKVGFVVQQSAALGLLGVQKVIGTVTRNILGRMDGQQVISVCGSIRQFML